MSRLLRTAACLLLIGLASAVARPAAASAPDLGEPDALIRRILALAEKRDAAGLKEVLAADYRDPWFLAHELCLRGHPRAARALARANDGRDKDTLLAYAATLARNPPSKALWLRWGTLREYADQDQWHRLRKDLDSEPPDLSAKTVVVSSIRVVHAQALARLGRLNEAIRVYRLAADSAAALGWWRGAARALDSLFLAASDASDAETMLYAKRKLHEVYEFSGDKRLSGGALADVGSLLGNLGNLTAALQYFRRVLSDYGEHLSSDIRLHVELQAGLGHMHVGHYAEAQREIRHVLREAERLLAAEAKKEAGAEDALGAKALGRLRELRALSKGYLGMLCFDIGAYDEADAYYGEALRLFEELDDEYSLMEAYGNLGMLRVEQGQLDAAMEIFKKVEAFYVANRHESYVVTARVNIAAVERKQGKLDAAENRLVQAIHDQERIGDKASLGVTLGDLGDLLRERGELERALDLLERQHALAREMADVDLEIDALVGLAAVHVARGDYAEAIDAARDGAASHGYLFDRLPPVLAAFARSRAVGIYRWGLEACMRALAALPGKGTAVKDRRKALQEHLCFFLEGGRAGALLTRLEGRADILAAHVDEALIEDVREARTAEAIALLAYQSAQAGDDLAAARGARNAYEARRAAYKAAVDRISLEASMAADLLCQRPASMTEIQAALATDEILVTFGRYGDSLMALVLDPADARVVALGDAAPVEALCEALRFGPDRKGVAVDPAALRKALVAPLGLPPHRRVLLSPVGSLSYVPPALVLPDHETALVPSGSTLSRVRARKPSGATEVLALGDPAYGASAPAGWDGRTSAVRGGSLRPLLGTRKEAETVGTEVLLGKDASETRLRARLAAGKPLRCLHLACHGLIDEKRPSYSALALTSTPQDDGLLKTLDIFQMEIPAELVVLSACDSGRGLHRSAEGIVGLTGAFMTAGAARVLVSLWPVDDEASRVLMIEFHRLWNAKDPARRLRPAEALRAAQKRVREDAQHPEWAHPHYWAAWQLWGPGD